MIEWLATIVRWIAGSMMAAFFGVFLFSMWVTLTKRYRQEAKPSDPDPQKER